MGSEESGGRARRDFRLELSVDTVESACVADGLGVDRVELCASGVEGGLTPSIGAITSTVRHCSRTPVHVLVRPRGGDFVFTAREVDAMAADIAACVELGASGVVTGALNSDGSLDRSAMTLLCAAAGSLEVTFHRAIDVCARPLSTLDDLGEIGVRRVLTSGQSRSAETGVATIARFVRHAPRLDIMACGGVRPHNAVQIVRDTGVRDLHAAPRRPRRSAMTTASQVDFTSGRPPVGFDRYELDDEAARKLCRTRDI